MKSTVKWYFLETYNKGKNCALRLAVYLPDVLHLLNEDIGRADFEYMKIQFKERKYDEVCRALDFFKPKGNRCICSIGCITSKGFTKNKRWFPGPIVRFMTNITCQYNPVKTVTEQPKILNPDIFLERLVELYFKKLREGVRIQTDIHTFAALYYWRKERLLKRK